MSTQSDLDSAWKELEENARARCLRCRLDAGQLPPELSTFWPGPPEHTCATALTLAAKLAFAVCDEVNCLCDGQDDLNRIRAAIDKKLEEATR